MIQLAASKENWRIILGKQGWARNGLSLQSSYDVQNSKKKGKKAKWSGLAWIGGEEAWSHPSEIDGLRNKVDGSWDAGTTRNRSECRGGKINTRALKHSSRKAPYAKAELYEGLGEWKLPECGQSVRAKIVYWGLSMVMKNINHVLLTMF